MRSATAILSVLVLATLAAAEAPVLSPALQRVDLAADAVAEIVFTLRAPEGTTALAVLADCACLRTLTQLPQALGADGRSEIRLRVTGLRPGVEDITVATSAGQAQAQVQIVGPGAGRGLDQLRSALDTAGRQGWRVLGVVHDLRGRVRHCGCSQGSLGGAGRLARLPALAGELQPRVATRWVLSGAVDGGHPGLGAALAERGWRVGDPTVRVAATPEPLLDAPGVVAVIPTAPVALQHRRLLRPVLDGGLAVELLLVDAAGQIQERRTAPVDASLPDDPALAVRFPDRLTATIVPTSTPSVTCATCHPTAAKALSAGPHLQAWARLPEADRTDSCVGCHSTPLGAGRLAPAVHCQACHQGGDAHGDSLGATRTTGTRDCRSCHDAQHHPAFLREKAWATILHGREPKPGK